MVEGSGRAQRRKPGLWPEHKNQVCLTHLIRDTPYAIDAGDTMLGPGFKGRLGRTTALVPTHQAGLALMQIIKKLRHHLFVFVHSRELSVTNDGAERALRPCAVHRKITNGFPSEWDAALDADIRSVVETARRRAVRALDAIRLTLEGQHIPVPA
jgi:hypothetical protein